MSTYDEEPTFEEETPPEESSNRTFLIAAGILGALVLLALCAVAAYILFSRTTSQQAEGTAQAQASQQAGTIEAGLTQNAAEQALTMTAAVTNTVPPTNTPVIAQATSTPVGSPSALDPAAAATLAAGLTQVASTQINAAATVAAGQTQLAVSTQNPATMTIAAGFTQIAISTQTVIATSTALPNTGFADDIGIPGLLMVAIALVIVIFLVRRLRASPSR